MIGSLRRAFLRFFNTIAPGKSATDRDREITAHLALLEDDFVRRGFSPEAARLAARRSLGGVEQTRTLHQASGSWAGVDNIRRDLHHAMRALRRAPAFTVVAMLILALGIGANTAVFSLVYSALFRPLPFAHADRVLYLTEGGDGNAVTSGNFGSWRERSHEFAALGAWYATTAILSDRDETTRLIAVRATADIWHILEIPPAVGRYFSAEEDRPGVDPVVVLSHRLWQVRFGADPRVVGRSITIDGAPRLVVGVAGAGYERADILFDLWVPAAFTPNDLAEHGDHELTVYGLIRPGATADGAMAELERIEHDLKAQYPQAGLDGIVRGQTYRQAFVGDSRKTLLILTVAVALVLLIGCVNVTNLLLARAAGRQREIAVRVALGASRRRIVTQLLVESLVLALAGSAGGIALAFAGFRAFSRAAAATLVTLDPTLNSTVLVFAVALGCVCSLIFGLTPALRASRTDVQSTLRSAGARSGHVSQTVRNVLVVTELVLTVVLLVGAGLLVRTAVALERVPLGFDPQDLLTLRIALPSARYRDPAAAAATFGRILEGVQAVPGVRQAAFVSRLPLQPGANCGVVVEGQRTVGPVTNFRFATPTYFSAMGLSLTQGRTFTVDDRVGSPAVVVVNDVLAHRLFGNVSPIGRRIALCQPLNQARHYFEVVGVVTAMRSNGLRSDLPLEMFMPASQAPGNLTLALVVRSADSPATLVPAIRRIVHEIEPLAPVYSILTGSALVAADAAGSQFVMQAFVLLGISGLILAVIGVYGVVGYFVAQRQHEIGVRMAIGASTRRVVMMVLWQGTVVTVVAVAIGLGVAALGSNLLETLLFGVKANDPLTFVASALTVLSVAVVASGVPALRAARLDPVSVLRV